MILTLLSTEILLRAVSYRDWYAQTSTTVNIYSDVIKAVDDKAAEVIKGMLEGRKDGFMNGNNR